VDICDQLRYAVVGNIGRRRGLAVATLVGRNGTKTGVCKGGHLVPPGIGEFGKAMQENDRLAFTLLVDGHVQAIGSDVSGCGKHAPI